MRRGGCHGRLLGLAQTVPAADGAPLTDSNDETRRRPTFCFLLLHSLQLVVIRSRVGRGGTRGCMTSDIISVGDRVRVAKTG